MRSEWVSESARKILRRISPIAFPFWSNSITRGSWKSPRTTTYQTPEVLARNGFVTIPLHYCCCYHYCTDRRNKLDERKRRKLKGGHILDCIIIYYCCSLFACQNTTGAISSASQRLGGVNTLPPKSSAQHFLATSDSTYTLETIRQSSPPSIPLRLFPFQRVDFTSPQQWPTHWSSRRSLQTLGKDSYLSISSMIYVTLSQPQAVASERQALQSLRIWCQAEAQVATYMWCFSAPSNVSIASVGM